MKLSILCFYLIICGVWCDNIVRIILSKDEAFSFDCQQDESVYFGRRVNQWTEIEENDELFSYLNLKFTHMPKDNILRVSCNSARSEHAGFYACRKTTWSSTSMSMVYQLILADVESFYWNYVCHGPIGSCQRTDDMGDANASQFEVADQTDVEFFCCASVSGYRKVNIHMNQIGERRGNIELNRKQEADGSWIVCANQRTLLKRSTYVTEQTLTCELLTDDRHHSTLSSTIIIKDAILSDPSWEYRPYPRENEYFKPATRSRGKLTKGKKAAVIVGSVLGGLLLLGALIFLMMLMCRNKTDSSRTKLEIPNRYTKVKTSEQSKHKLTDVPSDAEHVYEEPIALSENAPVFLRC